MKEDIEKIDILKNLKFVGDFPNGIEVLLVPLDTATEELKLTYKDLTSSQLRNILKERNVQVFGNLEQWVKFKNGL